MVQYIAVSGGACDVLSIFRQFAGEISFIKITENDNERVRVTLLCVWFDRPTVLAPRSHTRQEECTHQKWVVTSYIYFVTFTWVNFLGN